MNEFDWTDFAGHSSPSVDGKNITALDALLRSHHKSADWLAVHRAAVARDNSVPRVAPPYWVRGEPQTVLAFLGVSGRARVALDPHTPTAILALMSADPDVGVRDRANENSEAPIADHAVSEGGASNLTPADQRPWWPYAIACGILAVLLVVGFSGGYSFEVVDQQARPATTSQVPTGKFDIVRELDRICGGGEDYLSCVNQHVAVYNSVCAGRPLTFVGEKVCQDLRAFVDQIKGQYDGCGGGCETIAGSDGLWGWPYLDVVAETRQVANDDAVPEVTHTETCNFVLGPIRIGSCPRR